MFSVTNCVCLYRFVVQSFSLTTLPVILYDPVTRVKMVMYWLIYLIKPILLLLFFKKGKPSKAPGKWPGCLVVCNFYPLRKKSIFVYDPPGRDRFQITSTEASMLSSTRYHLWLDRFLLIITGRINPFCLSYDAGCALCTLRFLFSRPHS